jgi:outer membrane protein insertion porin family
MKRSIRSRWYSYSLLVCLVIPSILFSQFQKQNYQILGISVEGNKTADASTIIANTGLRIGDEIEIPGDQTLNAIKRLWSLGIFKPNIEIVIEQKIDDGVFLLIKVEEHPRIESYVVEGADEIDEDDIMKEITFTTGQILKTQEIYRVKNRIQKLYDEEGFLNATIDPQLFTFFQADTSDDEIEVIWRNQKDLSDEYTTYYDYDPDSRSNIVRKIKDRTLLKYVIEEGDEVIVRQIRFTGNEAFEDDDLKDEFEETSEDSFWKIFSSATLNKELYEDDKELLINFYRKNGYRDAQIISDSLLYSDDNQYVDIVVNMYEGPQYKVRNIIWEGNTVYTDDILNERLDFQPGDIYDLERFNQNLRFNEKQSDVSSLYQDNGYLAFNLQEREERVGKDSVDIVIRVMENNRFKIGRVDITGNTKTKDKVIRRELYTVPGDFFSRNGTITSLQQLANLQYFNVEKLYQEGVVPRPVNDSTVNINYTVEEKSSDYLNASVGYSGAFGFSGAIGVTLTNFSITEPFSMGGGQVFSFNWQFGVGNFYRTFSLGFTEPWFMDTPTSVGFDLFDTRQRYVYDLRQSGITLRVGRRLSWPDRYFYLQGMARFQYNDVIDGRNFYREGLSRQYTTGLTISRNDIDNPIFPSRGSKVSLNAEISGGPFLPGNVDYYKIEFKTDLYRRLFNTNRIAVYAGAELGYLDELTSSTIIQPFEFFFMGGNGLVIATSPLRGYDDRSVGPQSSEGFELGGRVKAKYTLELRAALALEPMPIYVLAFAEAGNVYRNLANADLFDLKRSVGVGARLLVNPIGLIGFDFGYGFDRKSVNGNDPEWLFHFQFGRGF